MLITKGDVKKAGKKLLSVFLAIIMIMSTMSVSFATLASAAYDEDPIDYLAEHLKHPVVQYMSDNYNYTYSGSAGNSNNITLTTNITLPTWEYYVEARDLLIYLEKAIKSCKEWDYPTKYTDDMQARTCTSAGLIEAQILGSLGNVSAAAKEFISFVLEDSRATQHSSANTSQNKVPANHTATVTISTSDIKGYLNSVEGDYTAVESGFDVSYKYVFKMTRGYYQVSKSSGLSKTSYYHNYVKGSDNTNHPVVNGTNTTIKTTVNKYVSDLDAKIAANDFDTLALMTEDSLDKVLSEVYALRTNIKEEVNSDSYPKNYEKLFPNADAKIADFEANVEKARELSSYRPTADAIKAYQDAHSVYGTYCWGEGKFEEATIKADYAEFMNTYRSVLKDETLYEFFTKNNVFSAAYIDNFHDNVVSYDLEDTKELADALYNEYAVAHPDLGDEEPAELTLAEKQVVYGALTGYINSYNGYSNQVKNRVFEGGIDYLLNLQEHFQCQVDASIIYFAENVNKDYTDVSTEKVIEEIATAKAQLAALNALKSSVDFVENLPLLDEPFANADTFIAYLYSLLAQRFTDEVNAADAMYNSLGRPDSDLKIEQYSKLNALVNGIERDIVTFLDGEGKGALITQATRNMLAALDTELMPAFNAFELDRGFTNFSKQEVTITREDSLDEYFRVNENLDDDMLGEYEVTDENVEAIIALLEEALKDETVANLLGSLINKDENGNPTGEAFSLSGLITGLLNDVVFTDELLNTIVQFLYPLVLKEFAKVWAGLPETINVTVENVAAGQNADVLCGLSLTDVESAIEGVGLALGPQSLARALEKNATWKTAYADVISALKEVAIKPSYNKENDSFRDPWSDAVLFKDVIDETTGEPVINEETGEVKQVYKMSWGINEATDKRKAFVDAAVAALSGVEPLLLALLTNKDFSNDTTGKAPRGFKIGTAAGSAKVTILLTLTFVVNVDPITLTLTFDKNDGWDNTLCPIFEALGLTGIKHSEDLQSTRKLLEDGLLAVIDQLVTKLDAHPLEFILDALPNLCYMIDSGMIMPLLNELKTVINYFADAQYVTSGGYETSGTLEAAMKSEEPINIVLGDMLKDTLPDLSSFSAIWNLLSGVELLAGVEAPDAAKIATLGTLVPKNTNASKKVYTANQVGTTTLGSNQAWYIQANRADVLEYLVTWLLGSGLLNGIVEEPSELINTIFANLENNSTDAVAAIVELLNQKAYPAKDYNWFNGYNGKNEYVLGNSANEIYLNPGNDWTKEKAQYLYENIDALLNTILTMAGAEFDLGAMISDGIGGLLTDKTLTDLAVLLSQLDLNALLAGEDAATGGEVAAPEAGDGELATAAEGDEGEEEAAAFELDVNDLIKNYLGLDLSVFTAEDGIYAQIAAAVAENSEYVHDFGVDAGDATFAAVLADLIAPLEAVLAFILDGGNLKLTIGAEEVTLLGSNGYNNAIVPFLEALGCTLETEGTTLEKTINALLKRIDALTTGDVIKNIIDVLPGAFYFIASNGLATAVLNLLQPVLVIVDTIRPVIDVMGLISAIEIGEADENGVKKTLVEFLGGEAGDKLDISHLDLDFIFGLLPALVPALADIDLSGLKDVIYDLCFELATPYASASTLIGKNGMKGAYSEAFDQADLLTVVLSFVLEWATVPANAAKLDELLGTDGIIAALGSVFADVKIEYGEPTWFYWFGEGEEGEAAFDAYIASGEGLPITLAAIDWDNIDDNDWDLEAAQYFAENIDKLVDIIIGMIEIDGVKYESLSALLDNLLNGLVTADTLNDLVGMIAGLLGDIDENLLETAGYILGDSSTDKKEIDIVGLKGYTCTAEIDSISDFINELAVVLDTYASGLIDWLFFGNDFRFAKKSTGEDTIVINGGFGYEKGLAMILEALGCELPEVANTKSVLGALATRVEEILANPVDEVIDLLPNLVYFLNANGAGVAVDNLLKPVYALLDKLSAFGLNVSLADLLKFDVNGKEIVIDLANLSLANIVEIVEGATGLDLTAAESILVDFCTGKITNENCTYIYKMEAEREDVITILLVVAFELISDETFAAQLAEMTGVDFIAGIKDIFANTPVEYVSPDWNYMGGIDNGDVIEYTNVIASYPNDWTEAKAEYLAENLPELVDTVINMVEINGVKYDSLAALLQANVNIFTTETLNGLLDLIKNLLGNIDAELLEVGFLLDVKLDKLVAYEVKEDIDTVTEFADELAYILGEFAPGVVEWLLLGRDFKLLVKDADGIGEGLVADGAYITINGAQGYAEGLVLLLEALGCENLPAVYGVENLDTAATVKAVLASLAARIDEIFANPVEEVLDLLPNLIYFLDADGVDAVITNTTAALMALIDKLEVFGIELDINSLVNLPELMGIADKYAEGDDVIALDNLTLRALLKALSLMTELDFTELENVLVPFALGEAVKYDSVSASDAYKMVYRSDAEGNKYDKHDMISVVVTAALRMFVENEDNAAKLDEMIGTDIVSALKNVFADVEITYEAPNWDYTKNENYGDYMIQYPNNWNEETAKYVTAVLTNPEFDALIAGLIDSNYASLSDLLNDKVNVFTSENLEAIVGLITNLLGGIDDGLLDAAGVVLGVDVVGLKNEYKVPAGITTVDAFAAELANVLSTYAGGVVEWLLLGNDYRFFVKEVDENGLPVDFIVINGAHGYANGLALLLEALGCKNLPAVYDEEGKTLENLDTTAVVNGVLNSLAARITEIFANPIVEVINLLPNLIYFLNTNGAAAVVENTLAAVTALLDKLSAFGINVDIKSLVDLKDLMGLDEKAAISLDNLSMAAVLEAVGLMVGLDLTEINNVLVGFDLGDIAAYDSVSDAEAVGTAMKMSYKAEVFEDYDAVTILVNLLLITVADEANKDFVKGLVGEEIYDVIIGLFNMEEAAMQEFDWAFTEVLEDDDPDNDIFSTLETSEEYEDWPMYGPFYTEEMAMYIADNFGMFVDNILYLLGLEVNGEQIDSLTELINELLDGSLYNSSNVIAIRDALAGVLANVENLEVNGKNVGKYIVNILAKAEIADIAAIKDVEVPEFKDSKEMFVEYICDVLEPLYPVLKYVLANKDISFFVDTDKSDLITLQGAEGYAYGIIPLLEVLGCEAETILTPAEYYAKIEESPADVLITSILDPLLVRVDEIIAAPADEILAILPNLIYFINSNGVDTVVKNTLNAVFNLLNVIKPIAKLDLYELIGVDLAEIDMTWLINKLAEILANAGYEFDVTAFDPIAELTVGKLESYTSRNDKTAYRMVYDPELGIGGGKEELVSVVLRLGITFLMHEKNAEVVVDFLADNLGMSDAARENLNGVIKAIAKVPTTTYIGMNQAQAVVYYLFYSADIGSSEVAGGLKDVNAEWKNILAEINGSNDPGQQSIGSLLKDLFGVTEDVLDEDGIASNGFISFFQKIIAWFQSIIDWFKNLFN